MDHVDISLEKIDGYEDTRVGGKLTELIKNLEILNNEIKDFLEILRK